MTAIPTKPCKKCKKVLPVTQFYPSETNKDGWANKCKKCASEYAAQLYRNTIAKAPKKEKQSLDTLAIEKKICSLVTRSTHLIEGEDLRATHFPHVSDRHWLKALKREYFVDMRLVCSGKIYWGSKSTIAGLLSGKIRTMEVVQANSVNTNDT